MSGAGSGLVGLAEIRDAARGLERVAVRTPLVPVAGVEPPLLVKPESLQPTGSFKLRGAYTAITASEQAARQHGVVAHSSGNHGHAVAYAAALLGVRAVVVVPRTAADALRVEQVGGLPFAHIRELVADIVTVAEDEMLGAVRMLATQARLVAEPGGAAAVAAWLYHREELPSAAATVAVLSGGNIDPALLAATLAAD